VDADIFTYYGEYTILLRIETEENEGYKQCEKLALLDLSIRDHKQIDRLPLSEMINVSDAIQSILNIFK